MYHNGLTAVEAGDADLLGDVSGAEHWPGDVPRVRHPVVRTRGPSEFRPEVKSGRVNSNFVSSFLKSITDTFYQQDYNKYIMYIFYANLRIISILSNLSDSSWKPWSSWTRGLRKSSLVMADFLATRDTLKKEQMIGQICSAVADDHSSDLRWDSRLWFNGKVELVFRLTEVSQKFSSFMINRRFET